MAPIIFVLLAAVTVTSCSNKVIARYPQLIYDCIENAKPNMKSNDCVQFCVLQKIDEIDSVANLRQSQRTTPQIQTFCNSKVKNKDVCRLAVQRNRCVSAQLVDTSINICNNNFTLSTSMLLHIARMKPIEIAQDELYSRYVHCIYLQQGLLKPDGAVNNETLKFYATESAIEAETAKCTSLAEKIHNKEGQGIMMIDCYSSAWRQKNHDLFYFTKLQVDMFKIETTVN